MANKTIKMELSHKSIQDTIKQLRAYQKSLVSKNEIFIKRLSEIGLNVIQTTMESIPEATPGPLQAAQAGGGAMELGHHRAQ